MKLLLFLYLIFYHNFIYANNLVLGPKKLNWTFEGILGKFDIQSAQRGFKIYKEVCSSCHSLEHLAYRNLEQIGFTKQEVANIAREYEVTDGPDDDGEMYTRKALPSDKFVKAFINDNAARASNNGALPPDLSLIIKARENGANYVYSLLTGYTDNIPKNIIVPDGLHYNPYFQGGLIAMSDPFDGVTVEFSDGTEPSKEQMAKDIVNFLEWSSEPELQNRKSLGLKVMMFLFIFTILFYLSKRKIWANIK